MGGEHVLSALALGARLGERHARVWANHDRLLLAAKTVRHAPGARAVRLNPELQTTHIRELPELRFGLRISAGDVCQRHAQEIQQSRFETNTSPFSGQQMTNNLAAWPCFAMRSHVQETCLFEMS
jgi:hypothetical protein